MKFIVFWLVIAFVIYLIGRYIYLFVPFIIALALTVMVNPLKKLLMKRFHLPLMLAVLLAMVLEIGSICGIIIILIARLFREIQDISLNLPEHSKMAQHLFINWLDKLETVYLQIPPSYAAPINKSISGLVDSIANSFSSIPTLFGKIVVVVPEMIIIIVIALVATYFMAKGTPRYVKQMIAIFPEEWHMNLEELGKDFSKAFMGFVRAEIIVCLVSLVLSIAGLLILHTKYAIMMGTVTGIFGILPVLGVGIVLVPWAFLAFLTGKTFLAVGLLILTGVVSIIRHVIEPKILGDNVGLDPLLVLVSMYIGLAATGLIGLFLGPFVLIAYQSLKKAGVFRNL
jgi:sporulation integral membrane protein YtvI